MSIVDIRNPMYRRHMRPISVAKNPVIEAQHTYNLDEAKPIVVEAVPAPEFVAAPTHFEEPVVPQVIEPIGEAAFESAEAPAEEEPVVVLVEEPEAEEASAPVEETPNYFADIPVPQAPRVAFDLEQPAEKEQEVLAEEEPPVDTVTEEAPIEPEVESVPEDTVTIGEVVDDLITEDLVEQQAPVEEVVPATHYFYCRKADGTEVTYKKNTAAKSYQAEVPAFRRYLANQGTEILSEEIK